MTSPQTLSEGDRRIVAAWAADCAERVLELFEPEAPEDSRPRVAIARTRAFARGELGVAEGIRRRFMAGGAARDVKSPAAAAAARAAGQAAAVPHMGAHALGAAAYAAKAAGLVAPDRPEAACDEVRWQLGHMSPSVRAALRQLPPVGENSAGPLGRGLLASGLLGTIIRDLQAGFSDPNARSRIPNRAQAQQRPPSSSAWRARHATANSLPCAERAHLGDRFRLPRGPRSQYRVGERLSEYPEQELWLPGDPAQSFTG